MTVHKGTQHPRPGVRYPEAGETWRVKETGHECTVLSVDFVEGTVHHTGSNPLSNGGKTVIDFFFERFQCEPKPEDYFKQEFPANPEEVFIDVRRVKHRDVWADRRQGNENIAALKAALTEWKGHAAEARKRVAEIAKERDDAVTDREIAERSLVEMMKKVAAVQDSSLGIKPTLTVFGPDGNGDDVA